MAAFATSCSLTVPDRSSNNSVPRQKAITNNIGKVPLQNSGSS